MRVLNAAQMREADRITIDDIGIGSLVLMECAGRQVVAVFLVGRAADVSGDARINLDILGRLGHTLVEIGNEQEWELHASDVSACDLVVDALFGTGLSRPLT